MREFPDIDAANDLRFVLRRLRRGPVMAAVIVLTLGLGIGGNMAMFPVVDRLLLSGPAGIRDAAQVTRVYHTEETPGRPSASDVFDFPAYLAVRAHARSFQDVAAYATLPATLGRGVGARHISAAYVSGSLFRTLGVSPIAGRVIGPADDGSATTLRPAVVSYVLWVKQFAGSRAALGSTVVIDDHPYVVVGIAPAGFLGTDVEPADVWLPIAAVAGRLGADWTSAWDAQWVNVVGRLAPSVTREAAGAELTRVFRAAYGGQDHPTAEATLSLESLDRSPRGVRSPEASVSLCVWGLTIVVLIIACTNVANLLLARDASRATETAVRLALGGGFADVGRLVMFEAALFAAAGAVVACGVAFLLTGVIRSFLLPGVAWPPGTLDVRSLITGLAATTCVLLIVGVARLVGTRRLDVAAALKAGGGRTAACRSDGQTILAISQCALLAILLVGSGLFVRSVRDARSVGYGVDAPNIVVASVQWPRISSADAAEGAGPEWQRRVSILERAADRLRADPAVANAVVSMGLPLRGSAAVPVSVGQASPPMRPSPQFYTVEPDYFKAVGTPRRERSRRERSRPRPWIGEE